MWTKKKLLIWGTTYPEFSKSYYETVCTGAIDGDTGRLVRIYPITLRFQKEAFSLYDWIEAEVERNTSDFRPESHRIRQDSIKVIRSVGTADGWEERRSWVLRPTNVFKSIEALKSAEMLDHTSFGVVRPKTIEKVYARRKKDDERQSWEDKKSEAAAQREMFVDPDSLVRDLAWVPVEYRVKFSCDDPGCTGHDCSLLDWGIYVLHRRMFAQSGGSPQTAVDKVVQRIERCLDLTKRDAHLFMGNTKAHTQNFMIVGMFFPPIVPPPSAQLKLF